MRKDIIYLAVTADNYELPMAVFDNVKEVADWLGVSYNYARTLIFRKTVCKGQCRILRVVLRGAKK